MSGQKFRQRVISGYLRVTGRSMFKPDEFVDWLETRPDHEAYSAFFGRSDAELARQFRIDLARKFAAGCRLYFTREMEPIPEPTEEAVFAFPAYVSPRETRTSGGGYLPYDASLNDELLGQAEEALEAWLERYSGVMRQSGLTVAQIEKVAGGIAKTRAGFALAS